MNKINEQYFKQEVLKNYKKYQLVKIGGKFYTIDDKGLELEPVEMDIELKPIHYVMYWVTVATISIMIALII